MDVVRIFLNSIDIMPGTLLVHFLRFMGFYVEQNETQNSCVGEESVLDIYLISNDFFENHENTLDDIDLQKSVLVLKDAWYSEDDAVKSIYWNGEMTNEAFLTEFIQLISEQIVECEKARLLQSDLKWKEQVIEIAKKYTECKLLESSLVTRCFYKQNEFYNWGIGNYRKFIDVLSTNNMSDYMRYVTVMAKYEANLISKKNSYEYYYDTKVLLNECNELLERYNENEELHLLRADILYELEDNCLEACRRYGEEEVSHCAYAYLKRAKIVRNYFGEHENAIFLLKESLMIFPEYYQVWYQLGDTYESMGKRKMAIEAFRRVYEVLENKLERQILSPMEWEYIYKSVMRIAMIYKINYGDYISAYDYNDIANSINEESVIDNYIVQMLGEDLSIDNLRAKIYEAIKEHVNIKLEEIY